MPVRQEIREGRVPVKVYTGEIEPAARLQLVNVSQLPVVHHHIAAMPDVHLGIGATVGSVIPALKAIIPAAVGVDIGCGMMAARLSLTGNDFAERELKKVFSQIERDVPVGFNQHDDARTSAAKPFRKKLSAILEKHPGIQKRVGKHSSWAHQMGSLGGGIRLKYSNPMLLDDVAADFPAMPIVLAHPSFPWQEEALSVATHKPQVYIDLSGWSPKYFPPILVQYANTLLKDKILFGSDYPALHPERWMEEFDKLPIKPEVRPLIMKGNAAKLLKL